MKNKLQFLRRITPMLALAVIMLAPSWGWAQPYAGIGTFTKITSLVDLTDGYYVIVNSGEGFAMNSTNAGSFFTHTAVTPASDVITNPAANIVWKIETNAGGLSIYNEASAKYVSYTGTSNAAQATATATTNNQRWTFTDVSSVFTVKNMGVTTRFLKYNPSSPRFACYTTGQQDLLLYKMGSAPTTPTILVSPTSMSGFTYEVGDGPSTEQEFTVSGLNLTADISIAATANYEISKTSGSGYDTPLTYTQTAGAVAEQTVYVRLIAGLAAGDYNSEIITATSAGATNKTVTCSGSVTAPPVPGYLVDFEGAGETKGSYTSGTVTLSGLDWDMTEALIGTEVSEWKNGIRSARMRGYGTSAMTMLSDKSNGIGTVSFNYRRYGTDTQVNWKVEYSTNAGVSWTQIGSDFTAPLTDVVQLFSEVVNVSGNIRIRIKRATETGTSNSRLNIDDIMLSDFGSDTAPIISNIVQIPDDNILSTTTVSVSADVTDSNGTIEGVELSWGIASGNLANHIVMSLISGSTYTTDTDIPAQSNGVTVYYEIYAIDDAAEDATSAEQSYTVTDPVTEPTNHPSGFEAEANSSSAIIVAWVDAVPSAAGYLIKGSATSYEAIFAPVDGTPESDDLLVQNFSAGDEIHEFTGLSASTQYFFKIYPYNGSGTEINYKTDGSVPTANATTLAAPAQPAVTVTSRPSHIDLSEVTSESAVLMTLSNYSSDDARYRLYKGSNQYACWDEATAEYVTLTSYASGPQVPGTPSTTTTFWIVFQRGNNITYEVSYRDRLGSLYDANYQTAALPAATSITTPFTLSGTFLGSGSYTPAGKHVVLAYSGTDLVSAASTALTTGDFAVVCPDGTTIDKIEIRAVNNTLLESVTGSWTATTNLGYIPAIPLGTSMFIGIGNWSEEARWIPGIPDELTDAVINGNVTVDGAGECKDLTIRYTGTVTVNPSKVLVINGNLLIQSNATGTGSFISSSADYLIIGTTTIQRYLTGGWSAWNSGWHHISSPVAAQSISAFATGNYDFYGWNEPTDTWINFKEDGTVPLFHVWNGGTNFNIGQGYLTSFQDATSTKTFTGTLNTEDIAIENMTTSGASYNGWHLLGNPYASALIWNETDSEWYLDNVAENAKIWKEDNKGYSDIAANGIIPSAQGFMIQVDNVSNGIIIPKDSRTHNTQPFYKSGNEQLLLVAAETEGGSAQESKIIVNPMATEGFDFAYDSRFLAGYAPLFYSVVGDEFVSTNSLPELTSGKVIPFGFVKNAASAFTIELKESIAGSVVYLTDSKTGTVTNLTETPVYSFTSNNGDDANRFIVTFGSLGINNPDAAEAIQAYAYGDVLYVATSMKESALVNVYNLTGQLVMQAKTGGNTVSTFNTSSLSNGVYVVNVIHNQGVVSQKVIIRK